MRGSLVCLLTGSRRLNSGASPGLTLEALDGAGHDLVEDVVGALEGLLGDDTGLLQQV